MRPMLVLVSVIAFSTVARADNNRVTAVEARTVPKACADLAWVPSDARTMTPTLEAYTSIAGCIVRERTRALELRPDRNSVDQLELAVRPAIDLLDTTIEAGDVAHQIVALHAKANIYDGLTVMIRNAARRNPGFAKQKEVDHLVEAWRDHARDANRKVIALADRAPGLVKSNAVIAYAVRDSRAENRNPVASR